MSHMTGISLAVDELLFAAGETEGGGGGEGAAGAGAAPPASGRKSIERVDAETAEVLETATRKELDLELGRLSSQPTPTAASFQAQVALLAAKAKVVGNDGKHARSVLDGFKALSETLSRERARLSPRRLAVLTRRVVNIAHVRGEALEMVASVKRVLDASTDSEHQLTPIHTDFLALCISCQCYHIACELTVPKVIVPGVGLEATDVQLFYYYWSLVMIARRDFSAALQSLQLIFVIPASVLTDVAIDAWKKYVLVYLLINERQLQQPKYINQSWSYTIVHHSPNCAMYSELAHAVGDQAPDRVAEIVERHRADFMEDDNFGLVKRVVAVMNRRKIQRLTKTFFTFPLKDIAERAHLASQQEAERVLLEMIDAGDIQASIDERTGMATFEELSDSAHMHKSSGASSDLDEQMERCLECLDRILALRDTLSRDKTFVKFEMHMEETRAKSQARPGAMDTPNRASGGDRRPSTTEMES